MEIATNSHKDDIKTLLESIFPYRIEMHAHTTPVSGCSQITPSEMIRYYKEHGFHAVTVSNHFINYQFESMTKDEALDYYMNDFEKCLSIGRENGIAVYLAAEIRFNKVDHNDYLLYGCDRDVLDICYDYLDRDLESFRHEVKLENSVFLQAHPFRDGINEVDPSLLDGIETFNLHPGQNSRIGFAARYAKKNGLNIMTAGSDFHHPDLGHEAVGGIRTKVLPHDSFELAAILKSRDYVFEVGENSIVLP